MDMKTIINAAMQTYSTLVDLTTIKCGQCGGIYAIVERFRKRLEEEGGFWHCPYCKTGWGYGEGENDRLKKDRDIFASRCSHLSDQLGREKRSGIALRGHLTRAKKRSIAGLCPCCKRHFANLKRHIQTKHPGYCKAAVKGEA